MISPLVNQASVGRTALSLIGLHEASGERLYWLEKTPEERFLALELLRQIAHPYDPEARICRVLTIIEQNGWETVIAENTGQP